MWSSLLGFILETNDACTEERVGVVQFVAVDSRCSRRWEGFICSARQMCLLINALTI